MNLLFEGIKYQLYAKKRQGIHSPFVYELADDALQIPIPDSVKNILLTFDQEQLGNRQIIEFEDFGAGSKHLGRKRKVKEIHRLSSSKKYGDLLYRLTKHYQPNSILELGTSLGRGTMAMHLGNPESRITTVEGCSSVAQIASSNLKNHALIPTHIALVNATFSDFFKDLDPHVFDLVYIDGHHDGPALLEYCEALENRLHDQSLLILDDIRWSKSMFNAWNTLCKSEKFNVSIDFFRMGVLVKRSGQRKEHFLLKS